MQSKEMKSIETTDSAEKNFRDGPGNGTPML